MARGEQHDPDELPARARAAGLPVCAAVGLTDELVRIGEDAELDRRLAERGTEPPPS